MEYEWDSAKDAENRRKHRLALADGIPALEDPDAESWIDQRFDYGEDRIITIGKATHQLLLVVTTELTEGLTRIISVREAQRHEKERYYQGYT